MPGVIYAWSITVMYPENIVLFHFIRSFEDAIKANVHKWVKTVVVTMSYLCIFLSTNYIDVTIKYMSSNDNSFVKIAVIYKNSDISMICKYILINISSLRIYLPSQNIVALGTLPVALQEQALMDDLLYCMQVGHASGLGRFLMYIYCLQVYGRKCPYYRQRKPRSPVMDKCDWWLNKGCHCPNWDSHPLLLGSAIESTLKTTP